jgi:hypothetical protein
MKRSYWLAILALLGCDDSTSIYGIVATAPADGLNLTAVVTPATFRAGQMTQVTVTLRNEGIHTWIVSDNYNCQDPFEISTHDGELVRPPQSYNCIPDWRPPHRLEPASQFEYKATWRGGTIANGSLAPGTYIVGGNVFASRDVLLHLGTRVVLLRGGGTPFQIVN